MKFCRFVLMCAGAGLLNAQAPVEKAWSLLTDGASDKSYETRAKVYQALALMADAPKARAMAEKALVLDDRAEVRAAAALALGEMGAKVSAPKLVDAVHDKDTEVVFAATNALFMLGDPAAYQVYFAVLTGEKKSGEGLADSQMKMLKDPKALANMGLEAGIGFIPFGGISYKVLKMATADAVSPVRALAAARLAGDPDPKTAQALVDATKDSKWLVRAAAVGAIARRNNPELVKAIVPLLGDENVTVRFNSAAAVIHLSGVKPGAGR
jgi:HEAT repeat protein